MKISRFLPLVVGSAAAILASIASPARAIVFNVGGTNYDITTVTDTGANLSSQLQSTPWWGTGASNTINFVNAVGSTFGFPNTGGGGTVRTPYFAYQFQSIFFDNIFITQGSGLGSVVQNPNTVATYAIITPVPFETGGATIPIAVSSLIALGALRKAKQTIALKTRVADSIKTVVS
jgi:hypothetical protein